MTSYVFWLFLTYVPIVIDGNGVSNYRICPILTDINYQGRCICSQSLQGSHITYYSMTPGSQTKAKLICTLIWILSLSRDYYGKPLLSQCGFYNNSDLLVQIEPIWNSTSQYDYQCQIKADTFQVFWCRNTNSNSRCFQGQSSSTNFNSDHKECHQKTQRKHN